MAHIYAIYPHPTPAEAGECFYAMWDTEFQPFTLRAAQVMQLELKSMVEGAGHKMDRSLTQWSSVGTPLA